MNDQFDLDDMYGMMQDYDMYRSNNMQNENEIQQAIANNDILNRSIERRTLVDDITLGGTVPYQSTGFA